MFSGPSVLDTEEFMGAVMQDTTEEIVTQIERLGRLARAAQHAEGMKPAQWEALRYLSRARRQSRNPGALADFLSSTRGTVSQTLIALEKKGLIQRLNCAIDGRAKRLELTEAGHALMARDPLGRLSAAVTALGDCPGLSECLEEIVTTLVEQRGNHTFGNCRDCRHFVTDDSGGVAALGGACGFMGVDIEVENTGQLCRDFKSGPEAYPKHGVPVQHPAIEWLS